MNPPPASGQAARSLDSDWELERLREILLGEEFDQLLQLRDELGDDEQFSARVAAVISQALRRREDEDGSVADALAPTIDDALASSVANDPERLANSIYPIIGPAIRKSIAEAINEMLESLNQLLTLGLSRNALRWRFEAWRTGRGYSEVALLRSLEYRVEQVFLIHRETGLLLRHVVAPDTDGRDPDMVSGMLTAIQSFIADSFEVGQGDALDTMHLGELTVLVRQGPRANLAVVVRGAVPPSLGGKLHECLEQVHLRHRRQLADFDGDSETLAAAEPELSALLLAKRQEPSAGVPWIALLVLLALLLLGAWWLYDRHETREARSDRWRAVSQALDAEPGLVVIGGPVPEPGSVLTVLADPDARDPERVLSDLPVRPEDLKLSVQTHLSADPEVVLARARRALAPPARVSLSLDDGRLSLTGRADKAWAEEATRLGPGVAGILAVDSSGLDIYDPVADRRRALVDAIENTVLEFDVASTEIGAYTDLLPELALQVSELERLLRRAGEPPLRIDIVGYTDESGSRAINHRIGTERAETVRAALTAGGVDPRILNASDSLDYYNVDASRERQVRLFVIDRAQVNQPRNDDPDPGDSP